MEDLNFSEKNCIVLGQFCSLIFETQKLFFQCIKIFNMKPFKDRVNFWTTRRKAVLENLNCALSVLPPK